jgi:ADP-ribose pyrophosphatase
MNRVFSGNDIDIEESETAFSGFFRLLRYRLRHKLFSGEWSNTIQRELFVRGDSVGVLLYDPARDCVALTQQFRIGCLDNPEGAWVWEVVAGMVKPGENSLQVAVREIAEETGLHVNDSQLQPITRYYSSPGGSDERLQLYCALCHLPPEIEGIYGLAEESEDIRIKVFSTHAVFGAMLAGSINNAATIIALQWLHINLDRLRQQTVSPSS